MTDSLPAAPRSSVTAGKVASWTGGTLALYGGLNALGVGLAGTGTALLAASAVAFPPIYNTIARSGLALPGWARTGLFVVAAFAAAAMLPELPAVQAPLQQAVSKPGASQPPAAGTAAPGRKATPAPAPEAPATLLEIAGTGAKTSREFTTAGHDWDLHWKYDCSNLGSDGSLIVQVMRSDGSYTELNMTETGTGGEDTEYFHRGGTFYLIVNSTCAWQIAVRDAP
jgi:hypothetical protein